MAGRKKAPGMVVPSAKKARTAKPKATQVTEADYQRFIHAGVKGGVEPNTTTTFRITKAQHRALRVAALDLADRKVGGRPDASEVLRLVLNDWITSGAELPD